LRSAADQVFSRAAGAPLVEGNAVRVLRDAGENYPAWEQAIDAATSTIHIEMYIVRYDRTGRRFIDLLARRVREGVTVRLSYDWFGCQFAPLRGIFRPLVAAGGEVRCFNPPSFRAALGWIRRDHRKLITVDGRIAFVSGLCIGEEWEGTPDQKLQPWRDTGVEIIGPAAAHADQAFADSWRIAGGTIDPATLADPDTMPPAGDVMLRLVPTEPFSANLLRMDLLVCSLARRTLWITDAYFIGTGAYIEALRRAAEDGVDVRLLLPHDSDLGWSVPLSRSLYRPLLDGGVRIFEWTGTMVHAKTAVADGRWSRIGSTNLNLNSWMGNWELDVAIEDTAIAQTMEAHYLEDLERSQEVVFRSDRKRSISAGPRKTARTRGAARQVARTVTGVGRSLGAAVTGNRSLEVFEAMPVLVTGVVLAALAGIAFVKPTILTWPLGLLAAWAAATFLAEAWTIWRQRLRP
jgi:phosphatidylserine/phosphatidylglycerophosphate/cardiolipin synthase-like enzyme